ncbi:uncharacterized protein L201_007652 [Kwoniella dendrophila CBS 6074]|uniref:Uncharacterized protein n=1 Tax=Kwoniella dendrophila CBS 6074 TaxID=1295534 RepID=A0AAX4K697_9TREE
MENNNWDKSSLSTSTRSCGPGSSITLSEEEKHALLTMAGSFRHFRNSERKLKIEAKKRYLYRLAGGTIPSDTEAKQSTFARFYPNGHSSCCIAPSANDLRTLAKNTGYTKAASMVIDILKSTKTGQTREQDTGRFSNDIVDSDQTC